MYCSWEKPVRLNSEPEDAFAIEKIAAQMAVALENARLYEGMRNLFISTIASLANAIDAKSAWTKGHSERVMHYAVAIAEEMGCDQAMVERVRLGGLLHDIGKIGIIEALLEKPASLSVNEFPPMRLHPEKGVAILKPIEQLRDVLPGILHHHERFDGTGYPMGLKGESIPAGSTNNFGGRLFRRHRIGATLQTRTYRGRSTGGTEGMRGFAVRPGRSGEPGQTSRKNRAAQGGVIKKRQRDGAYL